MIEVDITRNLVDSYHEDWNLMNPHPTQLSRPAPRFYDWGRFRLTGQVHDWLVDHGYPDYVWGCRQVHREVRMRTNTTHSYWVEFKDANIALLFKLTWGGQ